MESAEPPSAWLAAINGRLSEGLSSLGRPARVLEAGGGARTRIDLPTGARFTTIDISPESLERNDYAEEKILGDLETFDYGARRFDLVVVWNVLEHLSQPKAAFRNMASTLEPGGYLAIRGPIVTGVKGLVTKFTPHAVHVWFYRHVLGARHAGEPGYAPFPTHLRFDVDPRSLRSTLGELGLEVVAYEPFVVSHVDKLKAKFPPLYGLYLLAAGALSAVTLGRAGGRWSDFAMLVRKPAA